MLPALMAVVTPKARYSSGPLVLICVMRRTPPK
jgi:hypothetical protein